MKKILLVVDMQNGFTQREQTVMVKEKILGLLKLHLFDSVIATRFQNCDNSIYERTFGWMGMKTPQEQALVEEFGKYIDYVFDKSVYTCINSDFIQRICHLNDGIYPKEIYVVGVDTDCCVLTIATALFEHNIRPIVLTQYCASNGGLQSHQAGLLCMKRLIGEKQLVDYEIKSKEDLDSIF